MKLNRRKLRRLIESIVLESKSSDKPIEMSDHEVGTACAKVGCPKEKVAGAVGFRGNNKEGAKPADIKNAIREKLGCQKGGQCEIRQVDAITMAYVGWRK